MARNWFIFPEKVLSLFFTNSTKRWRQLHFWGVKNAWKSDENYAFWPAPRTIHRPRSGLQTGAQNHAKSRQNASKITAKWARKNMHSDLAMAKKTPQPVTCPNATKCIHFCGSRFYFARGKCQKTCKIYTKRVQIRRKMSTKKHGFRYRKRKKYTPTGIFSIFPCFSRFDNVLEHCLWCFGISLMLFWWFFNFWTSFADFGWIWSKIQHGFDAFS